jgi:excisionase family DNA binding protein
MSSDPIATNATDRTLHLVTGAQAGPGPDRLADLPPVIDLVEAAALLGVGRTTAYKLVRRGEWPTPVLRIGRLIKVPTAPLRELLSRSTPSG